MPKSLHASACCAPLSKAPLTRTEAKSLARSFQALADPARLRLLSIVLSQPDGEACACNLIEPLGLSQPTVSHHLAVLRKAGLLDREKRGVWAYYKAVPRSLTDLRKALV